MRTTAGVLAILVVANVTSNRLLPAALYVPWNLAVAATIVMVAARLVPPAELGLGQWKRGLVWGTAILVLTIGALLVAVLMPVFHDLYHDRRVDPSAVALLYQALVRIPLGTVVLEEVAFRGVLPALFARRVGVGRGCLLASLCFGLWHVLPALGLNRVNPTATSVLGRGGWGVAVGVLFAVIGTGLGGLVWCWIRYRSGSLAATILAHVGTNCVAYVIAWFVGR